MTAEKEIPPGVDPTKPSIARVYDAFLDGTDNFPVDRELVSKALTVMPDIKLQAAANRAFLQRAVRYLAEEAGIRQFIDIGTGLPTQGHVHHVVQRYAPDAKVVYADMDPLVRVHATALLGDTANTTFVVADVREPAGLLDNIAVRELIDFGKPIGLLLFGILHHLNDDEDPWAVTKRLRSALPPGSYLAVSHFHNPGDADPKEAERIEAVEKVFNERIGTGRFRNRNDILAYFGNFELVDPGLVRLSEWRPDLGAGAVVADHDILVGAVGRK